jgi:hypothetical protein
MASVTVHRAAGMKGEFFTDAENLTELVSHMPEEDQRRFNSYGHFRIESAFVDRQFIVYQPMGLTSLKTHVPPKVLNVITIKDFSTDARNGCQVVLKEQETQQELVISHVPRRVYGYPIYMSVPARLMLRWDGRQLENGRVWRSLSFAVLVKTKNKADFYSKNNTYMETPNELRRLYPAEPFKF